MHVARVKNDGNPCCCTAAGTRCNTTTGIYAESARRTGDSPAAISSIPCSSSLASGVTVKSRYLGGMLRWPRVDVATAAAGLGSGVEGCHPLFRARGTGGGRADGCGRRTASHRLSWIVTAAAGAGESPGAFGESGDLLKGFMIPGTEMLNVKGNSMVIVKHRQGIESSRS